MQGQAEEDENMEDENEKHLIAIRKANIAETQKDHEANVEAGKALLLSHVDVI